MSRPLLLIDSSLADCYGRNLDPSINCIGDSWASLLENVDIKFLSNLPVQNPNIYAFTGSTLDKVYCKYTLSAPYMRRVNESTRAADTTFMYRAGEPMIHITDKRPRFYMLSENSYPKVASTKIYYTSQFDVDEVDAINEWAKLFKMEESKRICVLDMDEVLINSNGILTDSIELVQACNTLFDYTILWSHGSALHVDDYSTQMQKAGAHFNLILSKDHDVKSPKNLLSLYNYFPQVNISYAALVDDTILNYTPEYDAMYIPSRSKQGYNIYPIIANMTKSIRC